MDKIKCAICKTSYKGEVFDLCPFCGWGFTGIEDSQEDDEIDGFNTISQKQAKENVAKGLTIWGKTLPQKPQQ